MRVFLIFITPVILMLFLVQYYPYNKNPIENSIICGICESISITILALMVISYIFRKKLAIMYKIHMLLDPISDEKQKVGSVD